MQVIRYIGVLLIALSACARNPYEQFYRPGGAQDDIARHRLSAAPETPDVYHGGTDPAAEIAAMMADGYAVLGISVFNGPKSSDLDAIKEGKTIGAEKIAIFSKYSRTVHAEIPLTIPTVQTSLTNGTASVFGSGGMATAQSSSTTTTYGTQTTFIHRDVDHYDTIAIYLVKIKNIVGINGRNLSDYEARQAGSVNGVSVIGVVHGTPAASAGGLPGDIILKENENPVIDWQSLKVIFNDNQSKTIILSIYRSGKVINIPILVGRY